MSGLNCSEWDADMDQVLADSIAEVSGGSVLQRNVEVVSCTNVESRRFLAEQPTASRAAALLMQRKLRASQSVELQLLIVMVLEESGIEGITPENAFSTLETLMQDSVSSGALQTTLNARLAEELGPAAPVLTVDSIVSDPSVGGVDVTRSRSPTSVPTSAPVEPFVLVDNTWFIVSVAMCGVGLVALVFFIWVHRIKKQNAKVLMTQESSLDIHAGYSGFTNIQDEGIVQKPKPDGSVQFQKVMKKANIHENQVVPFDHEYDCEDETAIAEPEPNKRSVVSVKGSFAESDDGGCGNNVDRKDLRKTLLSKDSEKLISQEEGGGNPFTELREMMRIEQMAKQRK